MATPTAHASASWFDYLNPVPEETRIKFNNTIDFFDKIINWFKNLRENIAEFSIDLMMWSYETITNIVLKTPTMLFDNDFFRQNVVMFTGISIGLSMVLAVYDGFLRMFSTFLNNKKKNEITDLGRISKRVPIAIIVSALTPTLFLHGFKGLNWITNKIIEVGKHVMSNGMNGIDFKLVSWFEALAFLGFDIALIGIMIPVFLQNFRRWFDIIALGIMTPVVMGCWIFKSHEHYLNKWWSHLKKCATVQLVYAVFLLLLGALMFGTGTPEGHIEFLIKFGVIIGGLWRMSSLPNFVSSKLDRGADLKTMTDGARNAVTPDKNMKKGYSGLEKVGDVIYEKAVPKYIKGGVEGLFGRRKLK